MTLRLALAGCIVLVLCQAYPSGAQVRSPAVPDNLPPNTPGRPSGCGDFSVFFFGVMHKPVKGVPFSLKQSSTNSHTYNHQTTVVPVLEERRWRDSQGRERTEIGETKDGMFKAAYLNLFDPVEGTQTFLIPSHKRGLVKRLPASLPEATADEEPPLKSVFTDVSVEALGTKTISGVTAVGTRHTAAYRTPTGMELHNVTERWFSPELKINLSVTLEDKSTNEGTTATVVSDVRRTEPDPELFKTPQGYSIHDCSAP